MKPTYPSFPRALVLFLLVYTGLFLPVTAQDTRRYFGDTARTSLVSDLHSFDEAMYRARHEKKPVFFNCYASWAAPCVGMDQYVFSNEDFARWLAEHFICLRIDMSTPEGKDLAKRYEVFSYATYLVIDTCGDIIHRIEGGTKLPEFQETVAHALSPKTSLAGTRAKVESGTYSRQDLANYIHALREAGSDSLFRVYATLYTADMAMEEYAEPGNWIFVGLHRKRDSDFYRFLLHHKDIFLRHNAQKTVENKFESFLTPMLLSYACGDTPYDAGDVSACRADIDTFGMADTCATRLLCDIADLRGTGHYAELLDYMDNRARYLEKYPGIRPTIELSFNFHGLSPSDKAALMAYLRKAANRESGRRTGQRLESLISSIDMQEEGIIFHEGTFEQALERARQEGKKVFMDCFTSWCGPCRMMSSRVFTRKDVGDFFNTRFICVKMDMEQGEGPELARRYGVKAYPTMLFIDADGQVIDTVVGSCSGEKLMEKGLLENHAGPS